MPETDFSAPGSGQLGSVNSESSATGVNRSTPGPLVEGRDYYLERGLMVLTADFLRRRGYCCGNGCRHCPWDGKS